MIAQAQMKLLLPDAIASFQAKFPMPKPVIRIASRSRIDKVRNQALLDVGLNPSGEASTTAMGETVHGPKGTIIILYQAKCPSYCDDFRHLVWHEMGHVFVFGEENDEFYPYHCFSNEDTPFHRGYYFWSEFVADAIAFSIKSDMTEEDITHPLCWGRYHRRLNTLLYEWSKGDRVALSYFFATTLMDENTKNYIMAASESRLQVWKVKMETGLMDPGTVQPYDCSIPLPDVRELLEKQLRKPKWWLADERLLRELGERLR